jgi:hypothetical protein
MNAAQYRHRHHNACVQFTKEIPRMKVKATGKCRMNMSCFQIRAATQFARKAGEIEQRHTGDEWGPSYDEITVHVVSAIIMAASSLEAFINEVFLDANIYLPSHEKAIKARWPRYEQKGVLEKFQLATRFRVKTKMDPGSQSFHHVSTLVMMRNALVHFKPEWSDEKRIQKKIEKRIHKQFPLSPFIQGDSVFPDKCMSYGCAKWCVDSALAFVHAFRAKSGIDKSYLIEPRYSNIPM